MVAPLFCTARPGFSIKTIKTKLGTSLKKFLTLSRHQEMKNWTTSKLDTPRALGQARNPWPKCTFKVPQVRPNPRQRGHLWLATPVRSFFWLSGACSSDLPCPAPL